MPFAIRKSWRLRFKDETASVEWCQPVNHPGFLRPIDWLQRRDRLQSSDSRWKQTHDVDLVQLHHCSLIVSATRNRDSGSNCKRDLAFANSRNLTCTTFGQGRLHFQRLSITGIIQHFKTTAFQSAVVELGRIPAKIDYPRTTNKKKYDVCIQEPSLTTKFHRMVKLVGDRENSCLMKWAVIQAVAINIQCVFSMRFSVDCIA